MFIRNLQNQFSQNRSSRTPKSVSKVFSKHKRAVNLTKANISDSSRLKYLHKSSMHRRNEENFDCFYNTSPLRKIQKLREARKVSIKFVPKASNESQSEMLLRACEMYQETNQSLIENSNRKTVSQLKERRSYRTSKPLLSKLKTSLINKSH